MLDLHMGYVMASRSVESTHLFCERATAEKPELAELIKSLSRERQKSLAHELLREQQGRTSELSQQHGIAL
jgi:hypothetical protein